MNLHVTLCLLTFLPAIITKVHLKESRNTQKMVIKIFCCPVLLPVKIYQIHLFHKGLALFSLNGMSLIMLFNRTMSLQWEETKKLWFFIKVRQEPFAQMKRNVWSFWLQILIFQEMWNIFLYPAIGLFFLILDSQNKGRN